MGEMWGIDRIREILPQRYPFLFVDKVLDVQDDPPKITCCKNVTINDYFFKGHFPGNPVMPGVLIVEALAQASILLFAHLKPGIASQHLDYYLGKVEARFKYPVSAGDVLMLEIEVEKIMDLSGIMCGKARVGDRIVAETRMMFGAKPRNNDQ